MAIFNGIKKKRATAKLSPPWYTLYNKIYAFFSMDDELTISKLVKVGKGMYSIIISSTNTDKIIALSKILPESVNFGNVNVYIYPKVENDEDFEVDSRPVNADDYKAAFTGNKYFVEVIHTDQSFYTPDLTFIILTRDIISFFNDDLTDYYGNYNGLVSDVANDIMILPSGHNFCIEAIK